MKVICVVGLFLVASAAGAQTINPTKIIFTASSDHNVVVAGTPVLDHYDFTVTATNPLGVLVFTKNLGKPTPATNGDITADIGPDVANIVANGLYNGIVTSVGPGGSNSTPQVPFGRVGKPATATNVRLQ